MAILGKSEGNPLDGEIMVFLKSFSILVICFDGKFLDVLDEYSVLLMNQSSFQGVLHNGTATRTLRTFLGGEVDLHCRVVINQRKACKRYTLVI